MPTPTHHLSAAHHRFLRSLRAGIVILLAGCCIATSAYADSSSLTPQRSGASRYYYYPSTSYNTRLAGATTMNGLYSSPNFFPIAVWDQSPTASANSYRNIGINTFIALPHPTTTADISALSANGMALITDQDQNIINTSTATVRSWRHIDEPDGMKIGKNGKHLGCNASPSDIVQRYKTMKAADPLKRPIYLNLTGGVTNPGEDACKTTAAYKQYVTGADIVSFDLYAVNSNLPFNRIAQGVDNLRAWTGNRKPVYIWIETTAYNGGPAPTPKQTKAQVWMAIIHGANGVGYFCHIFKPHEIEAGLLSSPTMSRAVAAMNAQITSLAPVLNSPTVAGGASVQSASQVDTMTKSYGGSTYIFTIGMSGATAPAQIRVPSQAAGVVSVLGENRTIPLRNGIFSDTFAGYDVHVYKITRS